MAVQHLPIGKHNPDKPGLWRHKGCGVAAIFLGLLRHQTHIGHRPRCRRIERPTRLEKANGLVIDGRIASIRYHAIHIALCAACIPTLATGTNNRRHRGIDNHIRRHMQIGNAPIAIHHIDRRAVRHKVCDLCL